MPELQDYFHKDEPLHPRLRNSLAQTEIGLWIKHPLINTMYSPQLNAFYNAQLQAKQERVDQCLAEGDLSTALMCYYEQPWRMALLHLYHRMMRDDAEFWRLFGEVWTQSENLWQQKRYIRALMYTKAHDQALRHLQMSEEDQTAYRQLPDQVVPLYRGYSHNNKRGWSWTFSPQKARWFASRLCLDEATARMAVTQVHTSQILALHTMRGESEAVIDPLHLEVKSYRLDRFRAEV